VYIDNLIELINTIIDQKAQGVFLATDEKPSSTTELVVAVRKKLNRPLRLFTLPSLLKWFMKKLKPEVYIRLYESLEMNAEDTFKRLNFKPPYTFEKGINHMVEEYNQVKRASN
jgi:UDP-glucose 4-epimerase